MKIITRQSFSDGWKNGTIIYYIDGDFNNGYKKYIMNFHKLWFSDSNINKYLKGHEFEHIHTELYDLNASIDEYTEEQKAQLLKCSPHYQGLICKVCGCHVKGGIVSGGDFEKIDGVQTVIRTWPEAIHLSDSGYSFDNTYMKGFVPSSCKDIISEDQYNMNEALE